MVDIVHVRGYTYYSENKEQKMNAWNVFSKGKKIDTVFFMPCCDLDYVRTSLINHDYYPADIVVRKA